MKVKVAELLVTVALYLVPLAVGIGLLIWGYIGWQERHEVVKCGGTAGAVMHPGDRCEHNRESKTYEQVKASQATGWGPIFSLGLGVVVVVGTGVSFVRTIREGDDASDSDTGSSA